MQNGVTVAVGNEIGSGLNQLSYPFRLYVDDDRTVIIGDQLNYPVIQWKRNDISGQIVAGINGFD